MRPNCLPGIAAADSSGSMFSTAAAGASTAAPGTGSAAKFWQNVGHQKAVASFGNGLDILGILSVVSEGLS